jgi:hypothetical protein
MSNWEEIEDYIKAVCLLQLVERVQPVIDKLVQKIEAVEQIGGADSETINRVTELENQITTLKQKFRNPPEIPKEEQPKSKPAVNKGFDLSDFE